MVDDNPHDLVHDVVAEAIFGGHPIGRPVIGRAEVISSVSRRALVAYHRAAYAADNVVAAAGNVTHDQVVALLEARLPATEPGARRARKPFGRVPAPGYRFQRKATEHTTSAWARPGSRAATSAASPPPCSTRSSAARPPPRLFQEIREKRGMAYSSTASRPSTRTPGRSASTSAPARRPRRVLRDRGPRARRRLGRERAARASSSARRRT